MVIPFPNAAAGPQPIYALIDRCISFIEGFEDDPEKGVAPLLGQLRAAQSSELIALPASAPTAPRFHDQLGWATAARNADGSSGFSFSRHDYGYSNYWRLCACRVDSSSGRQWRTLAAAVVDDFGNLVEVVA
ncbi:hypothetical protein ABL849_17415 [Variovorax sp. 375MFSha3.1]|uniref:hypothetical protein n=1 Tax=Variovorax sp. 375MFSha3.1 TaxID=3158364 RepID=UPI003AAEBA93